MPFMDLVMRSNWTLSNLLIAALAAALLFAPIASAQELLSPTPVLHFDDANGAPLSGGKLFTYAAGTTSPISTYTNSGGATQNTNPIILNTRGEANVWLTPGALYKFVLSPSTDTNPPTNPIYTVDNISAGGGGSGSPEYTGAVVTGSSVILAAVETISVNATAATTQTLPLNPSLWERHTIVDQAGNSGTFPIDVSGNGNQIAWGGVTYTDFYITYNGRSIDLQWNGTKWNVE